MPSHQRTAKAATATAACSVTLARSSPAIRAPNLLLSGGAPSSPPELPRRLSTWSYVFPFRPSPAPSPNLAKNACYFAALFIVLHVICRIASQAVTITDFTKYDGAQSMGAVMKSNVNSPVNAGATSDRGGKMFSGFISNTTELHELWKARNAARGWHIADEVFGIFGYCLVLPAFIFAVSLFKKSDHANLQTIILPLIFLAVGCKTLNYIQPVILE